MTSARVTLWRAAAASTCFARERSTSTASRTSRRPSKRSGLGMDRGPNRWTTPFFQKFRSKDHFGQFLNEQWNAVRLLNDLDHDLFGQGFPLRNPADNGSHCFVTQMCKRHCLDMGLHAPRGIEFRTETQDRQAIQRGRLIYELRDDL